jgi:hypothetical protein
MKKTARPVGRPSDYSDETADMICEAIASGGALYKMCQERKDWPCEKTVYLWLDKYPYFLQKYARARERQADRRCDEIITIADEATDAGLARLRVDARKWQASKLAPKKYGDKLEHGGTIALRHEDAVAILEREEREQSGGAPTISE